MEHALADLRAARSTMAELGDTDALARIECNLGLIHLVQGRFDTAREQLTASLRISREAGHRVREGRAIGWLAHLEMMQSRFDDAWTRSGEAIEILREVGDRRSEGISLVTRAICAHETGPLDSAAALYEQAVAIFRAIRDSSYASTSLANLGLIAQEKGLCDDAARWLDEALALARDTGDRRVQGVLLGYRARLEQHVGDLMRAADTYRRALALLDECGDPVSRGVVRACAGSLAAELGEAERARDAFATARALLDGISDRYAAVARMCELHLEVAQGQEKAARARADELVQSAQAAGAMSADLRMARSLLELRACGEHPGEAQAVGGLQIDPDGQWFRTVEGDRVDLGGRKVLRRVLRALVRAYVDGARPMNVCELQEAGWPGERIRPQAAARRVYTALWALRRLGLGDALARREDGYFLTGSIALPGALPRSER